MSDFTAQDYRQLSEALEALDTKSNEWWGTRMDGFTLPIVAAARRFLDRYQICQTCDGGGYLPIPDEPEFDVDTDCPDCVGGLVPNQERLEAAAKTIYDYGLPTATYKRGRRVEFDLSMTPDLFRQGAAAAVRAFDKEPT